MAKPRRTDPRPSVAPDLADPARIESAALDLLPNGIGIFGNDFKLVYRSEEHTSELQSLTNLVCRLLLEKKKKKKINRKYTTNKAQNQQYEINTADKDQ